MIQWRPYQTEIIESVFAGWHSINDLLVVAATGAGKTNVFWEIADRFIAQQPGARVVILAHRKELIEQPFDRLQSFWPHLLPRAGVVMGNQNDSHRQIVVATVQTLGHGSKKRIVDLLSYGKIDLLIVDEAHHVAAKSYLSVIEDLRAANPDLKHLGVTATPERADKLALGKVYQLEAANVGVKRLIGEGWLCRPVVHGVKTNINLSGVSVVGSGGNRDYNQEQLVAAVETDACFKLVVKTHMDKIMHRPTIAFLPSVAGAYRMAELLRAEGISAIAADGNTPKAERTAIIADFKAGKYTTICNVALWTEGLDLPELECCHLVRPTKSDGLYLQMVGRVLRNNPGKECAEIFDYQPLGARNLEQRMKLLGIEKPPPQPKQKAEEQAEGEGRAAKPLHRAGDRVEYVQLSYFERTPIAWVAAQTGWRIVGLGKGEDGIDRSIAISPDGAELWVVWKRQGERWSQAKQYLTGDFETVSKQAEAFVKKHGSGIAQSKAAWRKGQPSEASVKYARQLGIVVDGMNAGAVSDAINQKIVMQAIQRSNAKVAAQ